MIITSSAISFAEVIRSYGVTLIQLGIRPARASPFDWTGHDSATTQSKKTFWRRRGDLRATKIKKCRARRGRVVPKSFVEQPGIAGPVASKACDKANLVNVARGDVLLRGHDHLLELPLAEAGVKGNAQKTWQGGNAGKVRGIAASSPSHAEIAPALRKSRSGNFRQTEPSQWQRRPEILGPLLAFCLAASSRSRACQSDAYPSRIRSGSQASNEIDSRGRQGGFQKYESITRAHSAGGFFRHRAERSVPFACVLWHDHTKNSPKVRCGVDVVLLEEWLKGCLP